MAWFLTMATINNDLQQGLSKLSEDTVAIINIVFGAIAGLGAIWFIVDIIRDLIKMKSENVSESDSAKQRLKRSVIIFLGIIAAATIVFPLVNTVFSNTYTNAFEASALFNVMVSR